MDTNVLLTIIILLVGAVLGHGALFSILMGLPKKLADNRGFAGDGGEGEDEDEDKNNPDPNSEEAFMDGLFGEKHETKTKTALATEDDQEDDDETFGSGPDKTVDYEGDDEGSEDDEEGDKGVSKGIEGAKKKDSSQDEKTKQGAKGKPGDLDDIDFETLSDDDLIDMIADPGYTAREKGFLKQMHADRRKRQEAQAMVDHYKLAMKAKDMNIDKDNEDEEGDEEGLDKLFDGKEDDDFMSVADVKKVLQKQQEIEKKQIEKTQKKLAADKQRYNEQMQEFEKIEQSMKLQHTDYEDMMRCAAAAMKDEPLLAMKMNQIAANGGNPVEYAYKTGKKYAPLYLEAIKKGSSNNNAGDAGAKGTQGNNASRMAENARKKKTSASLGGGRSNTSKGIDLDALDAMETDELVKTLYNMPPKMLVRVPKRIRDRALGG